MSNLHVMIGFDCDRPRGDFARTEEGKRMGVTKVRSLEYISRKLKQLSIPHTYFVCGQFLETMASMFGNDRIRAAFRVDGGTCEIADHTYSHNVFKRIPTRPDKVPLNPLKIAEEYRYNTALFQYTFQRDLTRRGLRAPLGHFHGLEGEEQVLAVLRKEGVGYVSSDYRDSNHSLNPPLIDETGKTRQPYYYGNGLIEVPAHGWHDTVFGGLTRTPTFEPYPNSYVEIIAYFRQLFLRAIEIVRSNGEDFFLGLVMHPYNVAQYDEQGIIFDNLKCMADELSFAFTRYQDAATKLRMRTPNGASYSK